MNKPAEFLPWRECLYNSTAVARGGSVLPGAGGVRPPWPAACRTVFLPEAVALGAQEEAWVLAQAPFPTEGVLGQSGHL